MKKICIYITFLLLPCVIFAQNNSNSWVSYNQTYVKLHITNQGVYRITGANLRSLLGNPAIIPVTVPYVQVMHAGKQVPIYISNTGSGFSNSDYIEFYAKSGNTGWLDTAVYYNYRQLNENYSLYNDTAAYFLTFTTSAPAEQYATTTNTNFSSYTPLNHCLATVRQNFNAIYNATSHSPYVHDGEGWCDNYFDMTATASLKKTLATENFANVGAQSTIRFGVTGISETRHDISVGIATASSPIRFDTTYYNFGAVHRTMRIAQPLPASTQFEFQSYAGNGKATDKNSVVYVEITYPRTYNFSNQQSFTFTIPKQTSNAEFVLLEVTNFDGGDAPILYIPEIKQRIAFTKNGSKYQILVPNVHKELECYALNPAKVITVTTAAANGRWKLVNTKNTSTKGTLFDLTKPANQGDFIIITHHSLWKEANDYAAYRDSSGKKSVVIDVAELYDQFAYGINKHPAAIHEFINFAASTWGIKPENILLIGKGLKTTDFRKNATNYANTLIPPMGYPASDILFTISNHKPSTTSYWEAFTASVNIGRIATQKPSEIINYLNKVRLHEQQQPDVWMKTAMHFGGGSNLNEQIMIRSYLKGFEEVIRDEHFGANVSTFLKSSSDVFEKTEPDAIRNNMNAGTSILNFFGHASGSGFDQNIDDPILFDNIGKYPLIVANSCYSGDMFSTNPLGFNEKWVLTTPMKGAIGFIANVDVGVPAYLNSFTKSFLKNVAHTNYGKSIGSSMRLTVQELGQKSHTSPDVLNSVLSISYHGDPAVFIQGFDLPDFEIRPAGIRFNPQMVSTDISNFNVNVTIANNGRVTTDSCLLRINAFTAETNKLTATRDTVVSHLLARETFDVSFNTADFGSGNYTIEATVLPVTQISYDSLNNVIDQSRVVFMRLSDGDSLPCLRLPELNEMNNTARVNLFITAQDVLPVFPSNFSIIPFDTVSLVAVAVDPLNPPKTLYFVIDTTLNFNSDLRFPKTVTDNSESIIIWKPNIELLENATYYWRIWSEDSSAWRINSFTYEPKKTGWAQQSRWQFGSDNLSSNNTLSYLTYDVETRRYAFEKSLHEISAYNRNMVIPRAQGCCYDDSTYYGSRLFLDNTQLHTSGLSGLQTPDYYVFVFDSITSEPWLATRGKYGHRNSTTQVGTRGYNLFAFTSTNETQQRSMANFLNDTVPAGNYILVITYGNINRRINDTTTSGTMIPELKEAFINLGAEVPKDDALENYSYLFFCQKGDVSSAKEKASTTLYEITTLAAHFDAQRIRGTITTPYIGPTTKFKSIMWGKTLPDNNADVSVLSAATFLSDQSNRFEIDIPYGKDTIHYIDALRPYMQLQNVLQDAVYRTPPKLDFWKVYFDPVGELSINTDRYFRFHADSIAQGDTLRMLLGVQNISYTAMDSVLVHFEIRNSARELIVSEYQRIDPARIKESISANFAYSTQAMPRGSYTLRVEFNPINPETGMYDQLENLHFNNILYRPFYVYTDQTKPSLDVTFDGRHLLNGDYISSEPKILITLFDENTFLPLQDTSLLTIAIRNLATNRVEQYYFANTNILQFTQGTAQRKFCTALFTPQLDDGTYELTITACDESGNAHKSVDGKGSVYTIPYKIQFKVAAKSGISTVFNFPNPAHDYTTFRIVLSGKTLPRDAKISIYSLQGTLVYEMPLRNLHIGTNDVTLYWDSSTKNLVPGVYMYHLTLSNQYEFGMLPNPQKNTITSGKQRLIVR